ncbi:AlwI family type II restriction endonuclease [Bacillus subtilis]|uniref:AlwI family type II restriction endonuclease n=1 Tax=Bacillus subtilis TaxID=1423 RepID=UPI0013D0AED9|nr:AlwI family type II restriction endonuclease [Bacillus subtilis]MBY0184437.1 AlwI family type II restriction endonuclease [Bacillus subtilis]MED1806655.1 AlwI family type II restriction endonuclease [Bacillus subtilis]MED3628556.1 AlwI family type II restriction endonuclease [Bacillus subtilis]WFA92043.1 AlwI family type II restriction endonuclease [Bacillus subtilis]
MASERLVWFITRPERDPKFHQDAIEALYEATEKLSLTWTGNREVHKKFEQVLADKGVKRQNISADGSGGRTWMAMLRTFAYCYLDDNGKIRFTKSGKAILEERDVYLNIRKQILTLQYPNAYFLEKGFRPKFSKDFQLRPVRFLVKVANQGVLNYYLTKEEITYFVMTARKDDQVEEVIDKIISFREAGKEEQEKMKQLIAEKYDHRERSDKGARNFYTAHSDVAHTFMLISEYTGMVEYIRGKALIVESSKREQLNKEMDLLDIKYPFNKRYLISLQRMAENNGLDIHSYKASGFNGIKPATNIKKTEKKVQSVLKSIPEPKSLSKEELIGVLSKVFPPRDSKNIAHDILSRDEYKTLNIDFVEGYINETNDLLFEDKTGEIFKALGFNVTMHPKALNNERTEIDLLISYDDFFGIIDAKRYKGKFTLSASFASHMASEYIPNYKGYDNKDMMFYGYVTAADEFRGVKNLDKINKLTVRNLQGFSINGILLNAKTLLGLLDFCIENDLSPKERVKIFMKAIKNKSYSSIEQLLTEINQID